MKKDLLLVLTVYEGRDWKPENGFNVIIEAKLDSHSSLTEPIPLTSAPKFNSEITWQVEKHVIRSYKISRVPIKVEFFAVNKEGKRTLLGYVVLPLNAAVEGVEGDPKWHKLLGTSSGSHKTAPSILLGLALEAMIEKNNSMANEDQMAKNGNTNQYLANAQLLNGRGFSKSISITKVSSAMPNGNKREDHTAEGPPQLASSNPIYYERINQAMKPQFSHQDEIDNEDIIAVLSDDNEDYMSDGEDDIDDIYQDDSPYLNGVSIPAEHFPSKDNSFLQESTNMQTPRSSDSMKAAPDKDPILDHHKREHSDLLKSRENTRQHLRRLSKELFDSKPHNASSLMNKSFDGRDESKDKRTLEISSSSESTLPKSKNLKLDSPLVDPSIASPASASSTPSNLQSLSYLSQIHSQDDQQSISQQVSSMKDRPSAEKRLIARLDEEKGFFMIGSMLFGNEDEFEYSISIYGANNLNLVVPESISAYNSGFQFCFSILGCSIYTEPFTELENPKFIVEKATTTVKATRENLSKYFSQHSILPIYLMSGDITLATCNIDLSKLCTIDNERIVIDKPYELRALTGQGELQNAEAQVLISVELEKCLRGIEKIKSYPDSPAKENILSPKVHSDTYSSNENEASDSSYSDLDKHSNSIAKLLRRRPHRTTRRKSLKKRKVLPKEVKSLLEEEILRHKEKLYEKAEQDVQEWKEMECQRFSQEFEMKEELLQKHIATNLSTKVKIADEELKGKLRDCDLLHERLLSSMKELQIREENIRERERKLEEEEKEFQKEKFKMHSNLESQGASGSGTFEANLCNTLIRHQLEKSKTEAIDKRVLRLQEDLKKANARFAEQTREILNLNKRLMQSEDDSLVSLRVTNERLNEQLSTALERKQFYKAQWQKALDSLHKLHSSHKNTIERAMSDLRSPSPQNTLLHSLEAASCSPLLERRKSISSSISKLKDERRTLLNSGIYASDHPLIKSIERKLSSIQESKNL